MSKTPDSSGNNRLATAPLGPLMVQLAVPTIFAQLVNLLYNMVDRIYVGRIPETGTYALAGLGVSFPIILLISAFAALVGMGGAPQAGIAMGQQDNDKAEQILGSSALFLVLLSFCLCAVFFAVKRPVLMMFGASETTLPYADSYLGIYLLGTISVQISLGLNQFISCQGFAKTSMMTVLIGAVINIVLDPILIYGFHMGVRGAALATIVSQTVSAVWVLLFLCGKKSILKIRWKNLRLNPRVLLPVLALGVAPFIMQSTECLVQLTFNTGMQKYGNDYYVGAMTILFSVTQMLFLPIQGLAQGATPIISYNFGARSTDRVRNAFKLMFLASVCFSFCATGVILLFPKPFISLFSNDPEIIRIGAYGIRIYAFGFLIFGAQCACQQTFLALGQAKISMFLALLRKVILLIPLAILLPKIGGLGVNGLFIAEPISDILAVLTTVTMFARNFGRILAPIEDSSL
ncbi:MAG: MATE family efflux transporter [Lachnospiraceae bacterium]|nr:MATE family efflux transporter [Lachnospiraceae bacterium]MDO5551516.1 MATE family efflux transporter [Lachnospiraceae bacterium]